MESVRVGVMSSLAEEKWHSIDLCAEMLLRNLRAHHAPAIQAERLVPAMVRRFERLPGIGRRRTAVHADRLLNRFRDYPRFLRRRTGEFDLFHLVEHSYGQLARVLPPERTVVTCHDLEAFRCVLQPERDPRSRWFRMMARQQMAAVRTAARVVCVSHAVRDELLGFGLVPEERVVVVPNGTHPSSSPLPDPPADEAAAALLASPRPVVDLLHVGSNAARKRIDVLLRVFAEVRKEVPDARLIRVGGAFAPDQERLVAELGLGGSIVVLPFLERETLSAVYRRVALVLQTSDAEGFGLPVPEAMGCGTPVAASDIPVLREVGGAAATYCPVGDVAAWTRAVLDLLAERRERPAEWDARRGRGVEQAARFSWKENARRTVEIYREVLDGEEARSRRSVAEAARGGRTV
jgi:glycosyltransferase involved in cell wall biosynthesis